MKADGVLNLLKFQCFQSVRMTSSLVRSTIQTLGIPRVFAFFGVVGFGWKWLDKSSYARCPKPLKNQCFEGVSSNVVAIRVICRSEAFVLVYSHLCDLSYIGWVCSGKEFSLTQIVNFRCSIFANRKADLYGMDNSRSYRNSVSGVLAGV